MKPPGPCHGHHRILEDTLARETRLWKALVFKRGKAQGSDVGAHEYEEAVSWLWQLCHRFPFGPDTFALAVSIVNRLLASVRAQPKYLQCINITALNLAAKVNEEDEDVVSVRKLVAESCCGFSPAEILRMERIILDKLHWDLYMATAVDFVHIFYSLVLSGHAHMPTLCAHKKPWLQVCIGRVQRCMTCHQLSQFRGSTLALAVITLEMEKLTPDWFSVLTDLLKRSRVPCAELIRCKEIAEEYLDSHTQPNLVYIFQPISQSKQGSVVDHWRHGRGKRPRVGVTEQADDFYDGFGQLYNEGLGVGAEEGGPCVVLRANVSPPPLQAPGS